MPLVVLGILIGLPLFLSFVLRVNAGILFLSLCAGSVINEFVGADAVNIVNSFLPASSSVNTAVVQLTLLLLPATLTIVFMRRSMTGGKTFINLLPAVASGFLTALLAVPLLPPGTRYNITTSEVWEMIINFQSFIIGAGAFVSLLVLWGSKPKHHDKKKHHKK